MFINELFVLCQMVSYERGGEDESCGGEGGGGMDCSGGGSEEGGDGEAKGGGLGGEKLTSLQLEYTHLLSSQLETQRQYFEDRMAELAISSSAQVSLDTLPRRIRGRV